MFNPSRVKLVKTLYVYNTKYNLCGRDTCFCLHKLDMNKKEDYGYYKECYDSWNLFSKILNRS
jgi:hypothetical protein